MTCLAVSEGILRLFPQLALKILLRQDMCIFDIFDIRNYIQITIRHAKTSHFDDCAGSSQGVQLLDG